MLREALKSLNSAAQVHTSEHGRVDLVHVLAAATGGGIAEMDEDMEHRRMVDMVKAEGHAEHSHAQHIIPEAASSPAAPGAAEANGHAACVEELLKAGADPAATDSTGDTPFAYAASRAHVAAAGPLAPHAPPHASLSLRVGRERVGEPRCLTQNA